MEPIGGYFSLELPFYEEYHKDALRLNTGRNCLEYILRARKYNKVFIPYYTCDVILEPLMKLNIPYEYYHINVHLELPQDILLRDGEALLYTNYYGLKQEYTEQLALRYGNQLIVDNTQAFYAKPIAEIDTFYSCRKFFGVPDGAYLYTSQQLDVDLTQDMSFERMDSLTKRIDISPEAGYQDFRNVSKSLIGQPIKRMSNLTQRMMNSIDYHVCAKRRKENFRFLYQHLCKSNQLQFQLDENAVPMVYPFLNGDSSLKQKLIDKKVFLATYWPNVLIWSHKDDWDYKLAERTLFIPIDQRYGEIEMKKIVNIISNESIN